MIYHSIEDAVEKIDRMLRDPSLEAALCRDVALRGETFTEERFMSEILAAVESFEPA